MASIDAIQAALRAQGLDGWLFFDHHRRDPLAYRVLGLPNDHMVTRRWYYLVPANGEPRKLAHMVEPHQLDTLPGAANVYSGWRDQGVQLPALLKGMKRVAMQYSPDCAVPYVSNIDAGTMELVRACGVEVVTSADLIQIFEAVWTPEQYAMHKRAGVLVDATRKAAFEKIAAALRAGVAINEYQIQQFIMDEFARNGLVTDHGPIVGVNGNASDPHYAPSAEKSATVRKGDTVLIDLWAKLDAPKSVYYDITWTGYCGDTPPERVQEVFKAVTGARDAGIAKAQTAISAGVELCGYEVDDATRGHLRQLGLDQYFVHRTGHSIGEEVHGNGANMDNHETHDTRKVIAGTCFSIEPGVYLPELGIRSEVNVYIGDKSAEVTGEIQRELVRIV